MNSVRDGIGALGGRGAIGGTGAPGRTDATVGTVALGRTDAIDPATAADAPAATMRIVAGSPTVDELAAVHSVIMAVVAEQAARGAELLEPPVDRWRRSARAMRGAVAPAPGAWAATSGMRGR